MFCVVCPACYIKISFSSTKTSSPHCENAVELVSVPDRPPEYVNFISEFFQSTYLRVVFLLELCEWSNPTGVEWC